MIVDQLAALVAEALDDARAAGRVVAGAGLSIEFNRPKRREHGDLATNVALQLARGSGNPRAVAEALKAHMPVSDLVERVEIAGPGFLNFHLSPRWLHDVVRRAADESSAFGRSDTGRGTSVNVEYVSANPTGPINVVSGRHAAIGDALSNLLVATGHRVVREFYINDGGRQMRLFGRSVAVRYLQHYGRDAELPEDGYKGEYVADLARVIALDLGDVLLELDDEEMEARFTELARKHTLESMRSSLDAFGTHYDVWFSEQSLRDSGALSKGLQKLEQEGLLEERDGATWFRSSDFGDDKDRVIVRSDGRPTYLASDVAYMEDKFGRGFDRLVYLLGADHHGAIPRLLAAAEALGHGRSNVEIPLVQMVTVAKEGHSLKSSKRAGVIEHLDALVEDVGADAVRYTFLTRSMDAPLEFDVDLAKKQGPDNPVYYVQYAHARICSILKRAAEESRTIDVAQARLEALGAPSEDALMRKLASYEEVVPEAARLQAPQRISRFAEELASDFSGFYRDCRVVSDDADLTTARLALCLATRRVIADALGLLGVGAPERM